MQHFNSISNAKSNKCMLNAYSYSSNYILADQLSRGALCDTEGAPPPAPPVSYATALALKMAQKVVKSVDNITTRSCETSQCLLNSQQRGLSTNRAFMDI